MDIEAIVNKHSDLAYGTMATDQDKSAIRAALAEQAETHAIELRAYDATVENLNQRIRDLQLELLANGEAQRVPEVIKQAISIAATICDAIPGHLHEVSDDDWQRNIGRLVNERNDCRSGYEIVRDAEKLIASGHFETLPDGWRLVPITPTDEMLETMREKHWEIRGCQLCAHDYRDIHTAMLAAAPAPAPVIFASRCPMCFYQHGHQIGCENNPVDIALLAAAPKEDPRHD